jgi:hypothetical protein
MSLPLGSVVTDVTLESLSASNQSNVPFTFGQVFKQGDMLPSESLTGRIGKTEQPLQYEVKATHNDGSVRHAVITGVLPSLAARASPVMQLVKAAPVVAEAFDSVACVASVSATIAGEKYSATVDNTHLANATWLSGSIVQEKHFNVPFTTAAGKAHPHLYARFAIRDYASNVRVDITVENNWAFEPSPQNFTYDAEVVVNGTVVYTKEALTHYHHARWRRLFWVNTSPQLNVKFNRDYLLETKAVPNYDKEFPPAESLLKNWESGPLSGLADPMAIGLAVPYMPMTGAHDDIGILPMWQAAYILGADARARNATLITANGAGTWSVHYRDRKTDKPVTLTDHPRMTIAGRSTDAGYDAFPNPGGDVSSPYTADISHQPSLAYLPYLVTGDYYYLEEMQFWAMFDAFSSNPNYRDGASGLVIPEQLRGQAWALRTIAQAAYITPDKDILKSELVRLTKSNLNWYNSNYSNNPDASKLGVMTHYYSLHYDTAMHVAPWMDDFFTSVAGHAVELGFEEALPLLKWKAQFPVGRMAAEGVCWLNGAPYDYAVRGDSTGPLYNTFAEAYSQTFGAAKAAEICPTSGDMGNISEGTMGYPSNMQPALAYAADSGIKDADKAWAYFNSRTVKPDYSLGAQFSIVPRTKETTPNNPIPQEPKMTFKVSVALSFATQTLPAGSETSVTSALVELLAADGKTVIASSSSLYEFSGIKAGDYVVRASGIDSKGAVMGVPFTQAFTIVEEVVTPPVDPVPTTVEVSLPAGITVSYVKE